MSEGRTSAWEWVVAAASLLLVLATIGFMLQEALGNAKTPPHIVITVDEVVATGSGYVVEFSATNRGTTTAASLMIEGELADASGVVERSHATIDYLPAESTRTGGVMFSKDPRRFRLRIRPTGYDRP